MIRTFLHPRLGELTLSQSRRSRRITVCVRGDGTLRLSFPTVVPQRRALEFLEGKVEWVERTRARLATRMRVEPALPPDEAKALVEELRRAAKEDLPPRIERLAQHTGLRYAGLTIRAARTKWGSCSARNTISLSLFLMKLPEHLRDFVIIHELCHTVHHDHSPRFHALVDRLVSGNEKALNWELRSYSIRGGR